MVRRCAMVLSTEWAQVEVVELVNDGNGLGFNLVGGRSTGVVIKYVTPGGAADKDGRLQSGDHVLQAGSVNLRGFTSEQVAAVLRAAGPAVRLLVARPADPAAALRPALPGTALVPTKLLTDPELLDRHLIEAGYAPIYDLSQCYPIDYLAAHNGLAEASLVAAAVSVVPDNLQQIPDRPIVSDGLSPTIMITVPIEIPAPPEVEIVHVDLNKNVYGLGITVAGYVCEKEELSGIFVKSIIEGSSAEQSGKIKVNDRIIEVDGVSLADKSNPQAVEILRNTGISVHLVLERYLRGPKFEHLQLAIFNDDRPASPSPSATTLSWFPVPSQADNSITEIEPEPESNTTIDSCVLEIGDIQEPTQEELDKRLDEILAVNKEDIKKRWEEELGSDKEILVAEVNKLEGLGISLEGTVDVECGLEVRPHHYIRSVLPEGPVGQQSPLTAGDELLEVNEYRLHGLTHTAVVNILKQLPNRVRLVCARSSVESGPRPLINLAPDREGFEARKIISGSLNNLTTIVKAQSDTSINTSSTATLTNHSNQSKKSRSLECVSGLAMWQSKEDIIELVKGEQGLGFSILDYQDPIDPQGTVIVVRSLVPGGVAEKNGEISPGDRVMSVNGGSIKNSTLDQAVQALKGAPRGLVKVGIARPLPPYDSKSKSTTTLNTKTS